MKRKLGKILTVITLAVICLSIASVSAYAAYYGDVDMDDNVTASDARKVLRHSAKLELLDESLLTRADVNFDKKISASDARLILRVAAKLDEFEEYEDAVIEQIELAEYNGIKSNKLPYEVKGLKIESIVYDADESAMQVVVRNNAGYAVERTSYITYKCYDSTNVFINERTVSVRNMNNNEACLLTFYIHEDTAKIVFYDADVTKCEYVPSYNMQEVDGMQVSQMPIDLNGIVLSSISFDKKYEIAEIIVSNKTGFPISSSSSVSYKTYNSDGYIIDSRDVYLEEMNRDESAIVDFYYDEAVTKFVFYASDIRKSESLYQGEMVDIGGLSVNEMPYTSNGICLENAVYDSKGNTLNVTFRNDNDFAISDYSSIEYKVYNADNFVVKSSNISTTHLNSNEMCLKSLSLPEGATKVVFGKATYKEADTFKIDNFDQYEGLTVNALPCTIQGLKVESVSVDKHNALHVKIRNTTGSTISSNSSVYYKCYNEDGIIIKASNLITYTANNNETFISKTYLPEGTVKVVFWDAKIYTRDELKSSDFVPVNDVMFNKCPVSFDGLTIESASYDTSTGYIYFKVVNNTGKNLTSSTYFNYRYYDSEGNIIGGSSVFVDRLNMHYETDLKIYVGESTVKIEVYEAKIVPVRE